TKSVADTCWPMSLPSWAVSISSLERWTDEESDETRAARHCRADAIGLQRLQLRRSECAALARAGGNVREHAAGIGLRAAADRQRALSAAGRLSGRRGQRDQPAADR